MSEAGRQNVALQVKESELRGFESCRRRQVLTGIVRSAAAVSVLGTAAIGPANAAALPAVRSLSIHALNTGERLRATFFRNGRYDGVALREIDHLLRDWRTDDVHKIDPNLLDLLCLLHGRVGGSEPFHLISGYRSPKTNAALAARSNGVARRSLHLQGMAADIRLPGRPLSSLHREAVALKAGGVGLYTKSDFVHVDTGRVRYWGS